jgi:hypothetical protein
VYKLNGVEVIATVNPLDEDQYAVFAGVHDKSSIDQSNGESVEPPGVKIEVKTVIIVRFNLNIYILFRIYSH